MRKITALLQAKNIALQTLRYCMSDCSESLIADWRSNLYLAEFVDSRNSGIRLEPRSEDGRRQLHDGRAGPESSKAGQGPLVVIANYVFDSLSQDAFIVADGHISEALVTTTANAGASCRRERGTAASAAQQLATLLSRMSP